METLSLLKPFTSLPSLSPIKPIHPISIRTNLPYNSSKFLLISSFPRKPRNDLRPNHSILTIKPHDHTFTIKRNTIARSEIAMAGSAENRSFSTAEFQLGPRIRGFCFYSLTALAAIPLFVIMLLVHPLVLLLDRYRRRAHHFVAKIWAAATISPFYRFEFEGMENLPPKDVPVVYVSNHQSFLDIYTLLTLDRSFKFISKTSIFVIPIIGWAMFLMGSIPLRRMDSRSQLDCLKRCIDLVKKRASVFFFPEGTRSKDGKLGSFKKGAFSVAVKTQVPIVPITLMGTGKLMPSGMEGILNPGSVKVMIHKPIVGRDADALCKEARGVIADALVRHGYGVH